MDVVDYSKIERQLNRHPKEVLVAFRIWVKTIETTGLWQTQKIRGYRDHALRGQRKGQRVACLVDPIGLFTSLINLGRSILSRLKE